MRVRSALERERQRLQCRDGGFVAVFQESGDGPRKSVPVIGPVIIIVPIALAALAVLGLVAVDIILNAALGLAPVVLTLHICIIERIAGGWIDGVER